MDKRRAAFERRASWFRPLTGDMPNQRNQMVTVFGRMGVVEERPGVAGSADFPPRMLVESEPGMNLTGVPPERNLRVVHVPEGQDLAALAAEEGAPWPEEAVVGYDDKVARFPEHG